jgi:hypothetical protein
MGYRFSLKTANTVANLTFGKVLSCYRDIYSNESSYQEFQYFLDTFDENFFFGNDEWYRNNKYDDYYYERDRRYFGRRREFYLNVIRDIKDEFEHSKRGKLKYNFNDYYV